MGIHDKEEESISSDQLPWASVMYPITAGGGQAGASQTPMIRQGNMVFGFFMDGQDQQVPVIMGIMGHNAQTPMSTKIGNTESNFGPVDMLKVEILHEELQNQLLLMMDWLQRNQPVQS
jgi:hypothetical protein